MTTPSSWASSAASRRRRSASATSRSACARSTTTTPTSRRADGLAGQRVRDGVARRVPAPRRARRRAEPRLPLAGAGARRGAVRARRALRLRVRIDERSAGFLAIGLAVETRTPGARHHHLGHGRRRAAPGGARGGALRRAADPAHRGPTGRAARHRRQPDHPAGRHLRRRRASARHRRPRRRAATTTPRRRRSRPTCSTGSRGRCTSTSRSASRCRRDGAAGRVPGVVDARSPRRRALELRPHPGTVVVAGSRRGEQAEAAARALGAPLLAEVASGARFGPNLVSPIATCW